MATRVSRQSRTKHAMLVRALAKKYEAEGYFVKADHIGHPNGSPPTVGGHIPDVAAYYGGALRIVAEAETCDTISDANTKAQWKAFSRSGYRFDVIVPKKCLQSAKLQASIWGVTVDTWWWLDI